MAATHLAVWRSKSGRTQEALAKELGVSSMTVSRWETGERKISAKRLPKVVKLTGIPARDLRPDLARTFEGAN